MRKILETLIELQDVDSQLQRLEEEKGDLPHQVQELEENMNDIKTALTSLKTEESETRTKHNNLENDVSLLNEKLAKFQKQLYEVKNNKEYDAITIEIETAKDNIDTFELEILELDEKLSEFEGSIKEKEEQLTEFEADLEKKQANLKVMLDKNHEQETALKGQKEQLCTDVPKQILSSYERIRNGRSGLAVAKLVDGFCSGCSSMIPPQRAMEIRNMNNLKLCEVCGRILVYIPEPEAEQETEE